MKSSPAPSLPVTLPGFGRRFWPVWLAGLLGVASLAFQAPDPALLAQSPELQALPPLALRLLLLVNPFMLTTLLALAGAAVAHRAGLQSRLAGTAAPEPGTELWRLLLGAAGLGLVLGLVLGGADALLAPLLGPEWEAFTEQTNAAPVLPPLAAGVLYGGLAEEVMLRWGVMSLVMAGLLALTRRLPGPQGQPGIGVQTAAAWTGIVVAALLFAAGHLPALGLSVPLTPEIAARTVALNFVAGLVYGWCFWRRGLEAAMAAHAGTHVGFALLRLAL